MNKVITIFMMMFVPTVTIAGNGGNIGQIDDRRYGTLKDPTYSFAAHLLLGAGGCTGGFIKENLLITNHHCADHCLNQQCHANFWNGKDYVTTEISLVATPQEATTIDGNDWAIFKTNIPNPSFKSIAQKTNTGPVKRGGFGGLRIIKDEEIPVLKQIYTETKNKYRAKCEETNSQDVVGCINIYYYKELEKRGIPKLNGDGNNFKIQECNITGNHKSKNAKNMFQSDCDSAGGDSGAPLFRGGTIVGLNNSGYQGIFQDNETNGASGVKTESFYATAQNEIKKARPVNTSTPSTTTHFQTAPTPAPAKPNKPDHTSTNQTQNVQVPPSTPLNGTAPILTDPVQIQQAQISQLQALQCD